MSKVRVGFSGGTTIIDRAIQKVSGSEYCDITHAFIFLLDSIAEAEGVKEYDDIYPGFWLHPTDKYEGDEHTISKPPIRRIRVNYSISPLVFSGLIAILSEIPKISSELKKP